MPSEIEIPDMIALPYYDEASSRYFERRYTETSPEWAEAVRRWLFREYGVIRGQKSYHTSLSSYDEKQEHTGAILALKPPAHIAEEVAVEGGLPADQHHVTLVYLGQTADLDKDELLVLTERLAQALHPFTAKLDGVIHFAEGAVALNVNSPYIPELRQQLVETLRGLGHEVTDIHGFTPHLTVGYEEDGVEIEPVLPTEPEVEFSELWLFWNGEQHPFPMKGLGSKKLQFITQEGQVVPIGGPSSGGGSSSQSGSSKIQELSSDNRSELDSWGEGEAKSLAEFAFLESEKIIGLRTDGDLVGVMGYSTKGPPLYRSPGYSAIDLEFISAKIPGQGVGTTLMNNAIQEAASQNKGLTLVAENAAIPFYRKLGMHEVKPEGYNYTWFHLSPQECKNWQQPKKTIVMVSELNILEPKDGAFANFKLGNTKEDGIVSSSTILSDDAKATPTLDELAAAIADRAGGKATAEDIKRDLLEPWLTTVFGSPASDQMQKVAARTFGFPDPPGTDELKINWNLLYPMGEMYNITQDYLKERGFNEWETVPVYRPYVPSEARPKQWRKGEEVRIKLLPLTSWTLDVREAVKVAEFLGAPGTPAFVLKTFIPIKSVVSTPNTGIGIPGTQEIVLAGGEYESLVEQVYT